MTKCMKHEKVDNYLVQLPTLFPKTNPSPNPQAKMSRRRQVQRYSHLSQDLLLPRNIIYCWNNQVSTFRHQLVTATRPQALAEPHALGSFQLTICMSSIPYLMKSWAEFTLTQEYPRYNWANYIIFSDFRTVSWHVIAAVLPITPLRFIVYVPCTVSVINLNGESIGSCQVCR